MESEDANFGYNALTTEYGDMIKMGVIVPLKVERIALQNAASVAALLLTTDAAVSEIKENEEQKAAGHRRMHRCRSGPQFPRLVRYRQKPGRVSAPAFLLAGRRCG
jgi:hypothetical protein